MPAKKTAAKNGSTKKPMTRLEAAEIGAAAIAAVAAAGAGYYFYGAKNAQKHRSAAAKWAKDLKRDVVREAKKMKALDEAAMAAVIDQAAKAYKGLDDVTPGDLKGAVNELKANWDKIKRELKKPVKKSAAPKKAPPKKAAPKKAPAKKKTAKK